MADIRDHKYYPTARGYLGHDDRIWGAQAGGDNVFAQLWMVYARADRRWAGADLVRLLNSRCVARGEPVGRIADSFGCTGRDQLGAPDGLYRWAPGLFCLLRYRQEEPAGQHFDDHHCYG